ncbi:MAG: hypothetical protein GXW85_10250, partial [Clostridia bacterium]|nr:hypothetical protein [Clostridia bacterium]
IFTLVTAIFLHSFIDFDLSYPVFNLLWWVLLANSQETIVFKSIKVGPKKVWPAIIALSLLFFTNVSLWLGSAYGTEGIRYMQAKNIPKAIKSFETSTILDPVNPTYLTNLAQLYFIEESTQEKGLKIIDKSIKYNPTNFEWYIIKTKMMAETGNYREAYENALKAIQLAPWVEVAYYDTAKEFVDRVKEHPELSNYAMEILNMAREKTESIDPKYLPWWHGDLPYSDRIKGLEEKLSSL